MQRALPLFVGLALLAATAPALADGPDHKSGDGSARKASSGEGQNRSSGEHGQVSLGAFQVQATSHEVQGDYVSFRYDASGIRGFEASGTPLFDASVPGAPTGGAADASAHGAMMRVQEPGFLFEAHDNPVAVARLRTGGPAIFTFAPDVTLDPKGDGRAAFTAGNLTGEVRGDGLTVQGQVVHASDDVLVYLNEPQGSFDLHRSDITAAIGDGHIGAEATFNGNGTDVRQDVVSYGNVTMTTVKAEKGNLTLLVEGHGTDGRVLVLNVDNGVLGAQKKESLDVLLDNQTVKPADNLTDALDPDNDGLQPEYYVVFDPGANAFQMIVSVPHYSVHTLSVVTSIEEIPPSVVAGVVLGTVLLVPGAFVLFRRR